MDEIASWPCTAGDGDGDRARVGVQDPSLQTVDSYRGHHYFPPAEKPMFKYIKAALAVSVCAIPALVYSFRLFDAGFASGCLG